MNSFKRISEVDAFCTYKSAYRIKTSWPMVFDEEISDWLNTFEAGTNCPKTLVIPAILSLTATLCGPGTKVRSNGSSFATVLNQFIFAVSDAGGGKSNTFERIILPIMDKIMEISGKQLMLENYTTAGLQKHQRECSGYGLISGDEGHRFLASVSLKQSKGEGERALLCKLWTGKGDTSQLSGGNRGFKNTSMSTCIFIQPQPFLCELLNFNGDDGLLDRFLLFASKPVFNSTEDILKNSRILEASPMKDFTAAFMKMYQDHVDQETFYTLTAEAQSYYNGIVDNYADFMRRKYDYDSDDDDKENDVPTTQDDNVYDMISSKDTIHILRLAAVIHIISHYWKNNLAGGIASKPSTQIESDSVRRAQILFNLSSQQKSIFIQATKKSKDDSCLKLQKVKSLRERILKAICKYPGPVISVRELQKHIRGSLVDSLKLELEQLERDGFGKLKNVKKSSLFFKPPVTSDDQNHLYEQCLKAACVGRENYMNVFKDTSHLTIACATICRELHPQSEIIFDLYEQVLSRE